VLSFSTKLFMQQILCCFSYNVNICNTCTQCFINTDISTIDKILEMLFLSRLITRTALNGTVPFSHISLPSHRFNKIVNFVPF
jgi:hypothetical protein